MKQRLIETLSELAALYTSRGSYEAAAEIITEINGLR